MSGSRIRVIIADDHDLVRNGLAVLLEAFPDLGLVGSASNGQGVVQLCDRVEADVVLMDLNMPRMGGIVATRLLRQRHPRIQVVALIGFGEEQLLEEVLAAGAAGYVFKNAPIDEVAEAIRAAACGANPRPDGAVGRASPARSNDEPGGIVPEGHKAPQVQTGLG